MFEDAAEDGCGAGVFLLPSIDVAIAVLLPTCEVLGDLRIGVGVHAASFPKDDDSSAHCEAGAKPSRLRKMRPLTLEWATLTMPVRSATARSSISSRPSSSWS